MLRMKLLCALPGTHKLIIRRISSLSSRLEVVIDSELPVIIFFMTDGWTDGHNQLLNPNPACRAAYARAGLSNWFCPSVVCHRKIFVSHNSEAITMEVNDEFCRILALMYLIKHKWFILIISVVHHFNTAMGHAYSLLDCIRTWIRM